MLPVLAFGVSLTLFAGVSWSALIAGVVLYFAMFALLGLLALPLPLPVLERPGTRATIPPLAGAVLELIRLGMVRLLDADLEEALWLAFGQTLAGTFFFFMTTGLFVFARPPSLDEDQVAAGRSHAASYTRGLLNWFGDPPLNIGLCLLVAYSSWLGWVTVPAGAALAAIGLIPGHDEGAVFLRVQFGMLLAGITAMVTGLALFGALG
ncbi:hypothetical protein [Streptosporangium nondiastaticum]|uniref:hypothetical protein n=1 Tax=Streptosporangium nondiastaticum TaxID=35764 RepID=UPI0031F9E818